MSSANIEQFCFFFSDSDVCVCFFRGWLLASVFLLLLIVSCWLLGQGFYTVLNWNSESQYLRVVPSPLSMMLAVWGLSYIDFPVLRYVPPIPNILRVYIMNGVEFCQMLFLASIEMIRWFLSFILLIWCSTFLFAYVESVCIPGMHNMEHYFFVAGGKWK